MFCRLGLRVLVGQLAPGIALALFEPMPREECVAVPPDCDSEARRDEQRWRRYPVRESAGWRTACVPGLRLTGA
jgi:hypothetical protein